MKYTISLWVLLAGMAGAETKSVFLEDINGDRLRIASVEVSEAGTYEVVMDETHFEDHFLSMRPFKCLEGPDKHWCHVPYPYEIKRDISTELTDLEYDFLFVWKGSAEYGINMWNGVYYQLSSADGRLTGQLHEMDMDTLSAPPDAGNLRPLNAGDLHASDPQSHWLPILVVE